MITLSSLLFIFLFASCMKNDEVVLKERKTRAVFTPSMKGTLTKALVDDSNITSETIRIQVSKSDGVTSYITPADAKFSLSYSGTNWALSNPLYLSSENATIFAYSPCPITPSTVETGSYNTLQRTLEIPSTQSMSSQIDYLWGCQNKTIIGGSDNINSTNKNVQLTMNHALAQVSFVIYKENYSGIGDISQVMISDLSASPSLIVSKAVGNDLALKIVDGSIIGGDLVSAITITSVGKTITETSLATTDPAVLKTKVNAYVLLAPVTIADKTKVQFSFTIDSKDYNVSLTGAGSIGWQAGQQYIYKVKLSGTQIIIDGVTVTPWTENYSGEVEIK